MKRVLATLLSILLIISIVPPITGNAATYTYNPDAAITYAKAHYNDGKGLCAEFVSDCLKAGGFTAVYNVRARDLGRQLQGYGTKITCSGWSSSSCLKASMFNGTLSKGDVIVWENASGSSSTGHVMLYSGKTNSKGQILVYAHNSAKNEEVIKPSSSASTVYAIHLTSTTENNYTYSFNFNANGGTLGTSGAFSVKYGEQFQILNTTCTRSGYTWAGWNVKRNKDNKWYVDGQGWRSESEINNNGYIKKVYPNYKTVTLDNSWISGITGDCSYTFYAVWIKNRSDTLDVFMSPYGRGYDHVTAFNNRTTTVYAQETIWAWYILYDGNTGDLMNSYSDLTYSVYLAVYDPNGKCVGDCTYNDSSDANWIGITPQMSGTYTVTATISGAYSGTWSRTFEVLYDTELIASANSVSLNLNGTNTKTVEFTPSGYYPGLKGYTANLDSTIASATEHYWSSEKFYFTIQGNKVGETTLSVKLYENYTGNKNQVATLSIPVKVTANSYVISYDANGGSGAPPSQTKYYGTDITLSSTKPVGKTYTVKFDGNGGSTSSTTKTFPQSFSGWNTYKSGAGTSYSPGSKFSSNLDVTLYAQWSNPNFSGVNAARNGYYFLGWYDSKSTNSAGLPTGKKYDSTTKVTSDVTLYAMWSKSANLLFGDYNLDGELTYLQDVSALLNLINGLITTDYPIQEVMFRCDLNRDGELDAVDALTINKLRLGEISQSDLPSVGSKFVGIEIYEYPQTDFRYGDKLETERLSIVAFFENGEAYLIEDNYIVSGYDPNVIGKQTLTVNYYQYSTMYTVTVHPPEFTVRLDANGGTVKYSGYVFTYGEEIGTLVSPERAGYTFLGWTFEKTGTNYVKSTDIYSYMSDKTLYAQWEKNSYTISYNANGGSGAPTPQTKTHNVDLELSSIEPTRTGYTFLGWSTSSTSTSATYQAGSSFTNNANTILYAVWSKKDVNLPSAYLDSTDNLSNVQTVTISMYDDEGVFAYYWGADSTYTNNEYRECSFIATNITTEREVSKPGEYGVTVVDINGNISATYVITFYETMLNANGGNISIASVLTREDDSVTLPTPKRSGYKFLGWSTNSSATSATYQAGDNYTVIANTTLYAVWEKEVVLSSITIQSKPLKEIYYIGDELDKTGIVVELNYSDGTSGTITNGYTISGFSSETIGTKTVTVTFRGFSDTFTVTVKTPSITLSETNKSMLVGDSSIITTTTTPNSQSVMWTTSNTKVVTVNNGVITAIGEGTATITAKFTYNGKEYSETCDVTVELSEADILLGDVNGDNVVDAGDAVLISRYDAGFITLTNEQLAAGDVNDDGAVDAGDAVIISRYDAGFISQIGH